MIRRQMLGWFKSVSSQADLGLLSRWTFHAKKRLGLGTIEQY
jgi:hypothetical protein